jgi:addiction module HigA family antidote
MIRDFSDTEAERIWDGEHSRKLPRDIQNRALVKLRMLHTAKTLDDLRNPPSNRLHALKETVLASTAFQLTCNGVYASSGATEAPTVSRSRTTTEADWLHNPHAGEILAIEFMEPLGLDAAALARAIDAHPERVSAVIDGSAPMDAELDLRLARYFRMSEGFFLGLQADYELLEAKRALNGKLDRIVPRAA